jgi:hypothetical protein
MACVEHYPSVGLSFDIATPQLSASKILPSILPNLFDVSGVTVTAEAVLGGVTNKLFKCKICCDADPNRSNTTVLVRVFGADGIVDREKETIQFLALAQAGLGPKYFGKFTGGRVEGFLENCRTLSRNDICIPEITKKIAVQMAR